MTDLILPRRRFLTGLAGLIAAPAIVRASSLMPVKVFDPRQAIIADITAMIREMQTFALSPPSHLIVNPTAWRYFLDAAEQEHLV